MNAELPIKKEKRILDEAIFMINGRNTIRTVAKHFGAKKSTVHLDVTVDLKKLNYRLYEKVQEVIKFNKGNRAINSGLGMKKRKAMLLCSKIEKT